MFQWYTNNTYITPAVDALHLSHQRYPGVPVVTVLVIVLAKLAVPRAVCLHHVAVLQACRSSLLLWTLFTAIRGITSHGMTAGQLRTHHLFTVYLPCRSLSMKYRERQCGWLISFPLNSRSGWTFPKERTDEKCIYSLPQCLQSLIQHKWSIKVLWKVNPARCEWAFWCIFTLQVQTAHLM